MLSSRKVSSLKLLEHKLSSLLKRVSAGAVVLSWSQTKELFGSQPRPWRLPPGWAKGSDAPF